MSDQSPIAPLAIRGDVARRDAEGRCYHLDRTVDVIDTVDGPLHSLPIEEVLLADCADLIRDCSVVGFPGAPGEGQRAVAIVQLQDAAAEAGAEEVLAAANEALTTFGLAALAAVRIVRTPEDVPHGPTGKVLKRERRTRHAGSPAGQ
ncbi:MULTISPECIES: hypothetical protein [Streptomyces]|uniref:hypothetical protein n=1 Tax=Streptomyces TaxID=1883 RepID=UPI0004AA1FFE|nr:MULTISPECIES: hypothetical protein [Streptomyces]